MKNITLNLLKSMNKSMYLTLSFLVLGLFSCNGGKAKETDGIDNSLDTICKSETFNAIPVDTIPKYAQKIIDAYPEFDIKYSDGNLVFMDGTKIACDDKKEKGFIEKLDICDIEDMFSMSYDTTAVEPAYLNDCGRGRNEELFKKMYGSTELAARKNLVSVDWFGQKIPFTKINGASEQLKKVALELQKSPQLLKYLTNASSFYWRKVRGANRQSAHSYGIAIDINTSYSNYWLWSNPKRSETDKIIYVNRIPIEIVKVFEKYGFIWGGRWYHYDTMHFEYRPEFL